MSDNSKDERSPSEKYQQAIDDCCKAQVDCAKKMAEATCEVWSSLMGAYIKGVTKGLGGLMKFYIDGLESFSKSMEAAVENLGDKKVSNLPDRKE